MELKRAIAVVLALSIVSSVLPIALPSAHAADKPAPSAAQQKEARTRYERGMKLYDEGSFEAALVEMQRAYELAPTYKILYNLGLVHRQLNDFAAALRAFRQYLTEGGAKIPPPRKAEVERHIKELEPRVATATIEVDVSGAEITVDDLAVGTSPLADPVLLNVGKRKISAKIPGKPAATRVIVVAGGDSVTVKLEVAEAKPSPATPVATTSPTTSGTTSTKPTGPTKAREVPWVAWGITGALAAGAGVMGFLAYRSSSDLSDQRATPGASRDDLDAAQSRTRTFALVTDVLLVGTVVAAGVSTWLTLRTPSPSSDTATSSTSSVKVQVGLGLGSFSLAGSF